MSENPKEIVTEEKEAEKITPEQEEKLKKAKIYYAEIRRGSAFIDFMVKDIMRGRNRNQKRRIMKELAQGKVCREAIQVYALRLEEILLDINKRLENSVVEAPKEETKEDGK